MSKDQNTRQPTSHIPPFGLRMQPELKESLEASAKENGRSLNAEIVARLYASLSPTLTTMTDMLETLDVGTELRMRCSSTYSDLDRLLSFIAYKDFNGIFIGAQQDDLNDWTLVALISIGQTQILIDKTMMNNARPPRSSEIDELADALELSSSRARVLFMTRRVPPLSDDVRAAIKELRSIGSEESEDIRSQLHDTLRGKFIKASLKSAQ